MQSITYLQLQFETMALLPFFLSTRRFSYIVDEIEAVFDDLPPILDTESSDYLFAV